MNERKLGEFKTYNSDSFFRINEILRYNLSKHRGNHLSFDVAEQSDYHMYFITKGTIHIKNGKSYELNTQELLIYQPYGHQDIIAPERASYVHCVFSGKYVHEILEEIGLATDKVHHITPRYESGEAYMFFNKQIEYVASEFRKRKKYFETISSCMLIEFLTLYSRECANAKQDPNLKQIEPAISYIINHVESNVDIDMLIKNSHLSKSRFYALFKQYTGTSPLRFLTNYRLSAAADYLIIHGMKVKAVSEKLGFQDPLYFSRLFKKEFGMSPREYIKFHNEHTDNKSEENN